MRCIAQTLRHTCTAAFVAAALAASAAPALASRPVHRIITGCVTDGVLVSDDGYRIDVRSKDGGKRVDLSPYEGREIRYDGSLLPADRFYVRGEPEDLGPCR